MTSDVQEGPLEQAPVLSAQAKKTWREQRWERRRRRIWLEELLGWILVPIIIVGTYALVEVSFAAMGTDLQTVIAGIGNVISGKAAP
jgi:hypothetical protein